GSLTFEVQDIAAIASVTHAHGARLILDNTWATPLGFRAFDHDVDVAVHAATKYIGGHSDVLLGAIVANEATHPPLHRIWTGMGWSWGGFESLIIPTYPERLRSVTTWQAEGPCLRLHIGLEDADDLIADLEEGFAKLGSSAHG